MGVNLANPASEATLKQRNRRVLSSQQAQNTRLLTTLVYVRDVLSSTAVLVGGPLFETHALKRSLCSLFHKSMNLKQFLILYPASLRNKLNRCKMALRSHRLTLLNLTSYG